MNEKLTKEQILKKKLKNNEKITVEDCKGVPIQREEFTIYNDGSSDDYDEGGYDDEVKTSTFATIKFHKIKKTTPKSYLVEVHRQTDGGSFLAWFPRSQIGCMNLPKNDELGNFMIPMWLYKKIIQTDMD